MKKAIFNKESNERLDVFLLSLYSDGTTRSHVKNMISRGVVFVDGKKILKSGYQLKHGMIVEWEELEPVKISTIAQDIDFEVVYEDHDLLVINKPQGLVVHPCESTKNGTLVNGLLYKVKDLSGINGNLRPGIVHRLDKNTSGLMLVAKNDMAHVNLANQIKTKQCKRTYIALLSGNLKDDFGTITTYISRDKKDRKKMVVSDSGKLAVTNFIVLKRFVKYSLVQFELGTGRTHQIRVHAKYLNCPIVGDDVYGKSEKGLHGQLLHSSSISFIHPRTNKEMSFTCELPKYFKEFLDKIAYTEIKT